MNGTDVRRRLLRSRTVRAVRSGVDLAVLWRTLARSPLVDPALYAAQRGRTKAYRPTAAAHWLLHGGRAGLVLGPLLVPPVTLAPGRGNVLGQAARLRRDGFPRFGTHPLFDMAWYVQQHPEAEAYRSGPLAHWTAVGRAAGWPTHPLLTPMLDLVTLAQQATRATTPAGPVTPDGPVEAIVIMPERWPSSQELVLDGAPGRRTLVVSHDRSPLGGLVATALARLPGMHVVPALTGDLLAAVVAGGSGQDPVLVATTPLEIAPADLAALSAAVGPSAGQGAGPVVLAPDGTVVAAGLTADGAAIAAGQSPDDVRRSAAGPVPTVLDDLLVVVRHRLTDVLPGNGDRALGTPDAVIVTTATARRLPGPAYPGLVADPATAAPPRPIAVTEGPPRLRWAIKSGHPVGNLGLAWGDLHFARALAAALERQGQLAVVDPLEAWYRPSGRYDDVALVLRGLHRFRPQPGQTSVLWVISHPELVSAAELADFDEVLAASTSWAREHSGTHQVVHPLLQCTDAAVFTPDRTQSAAPELPLLFVGNTRKASRPLIEAAAAAGLPLTVVGAGWEGRLERSAILAERVANADLPALYRSAAIVLNDHWPHMADQGFLSNRLFDLTAVGAAWISDPATGMDEVFADVARTATDAATLRRLVDAAPASLPDLAVRRQAAQRIRDLHSFDARAARLVEIVAQRAQRTMP